MKAKVVRFSKDHTKDDIALRSIRSYQKRAQAGAVGSVWIVVTHKFRDDGTSDTDIQGFYSSKAKAQKRVKECYVSGIQGYTQASKAYIK